MPPWNRLQFAIHTQLQKMVFTCTKEDDGTWWTEYWIMNTTFFSLKQQTIKANILINRLTHRETVAYVSSMHQKGCLSHPQWSHRREGHGCACHTLHQHIGAPTLHHQGGLADLPSRLCSCESLAHRKCHRPTLCILYPSSSCPADFLDKQTVRNF
jgi:hypothetical protein